MVGSLIADHTIMITRANQLVPMVEAFLNAPMPAGQVSEGKTINRNSCPEILGSFVV